MTESDPDALETLRTVGSEFEAHTLVAVLREEGIEAHAFAAMHASLPLGQRHFGVPVQVRRADLERARTALEKNATDSVDLDWDEVDVGEREDHLPLTPVNRMPLLARIGFAVAVAVFVLTVAAKMVSLFL